VVICRKNFYNLKTECIALQGPAEKPDEFEFTIK